MSNVIFNTKKLNNLYDEIKNHVEVYNRRNLYTIYDSKFVKDILNNCRDYEKLKYLCNIFTDWDNTLDVPVELGEKIEELINSTDGYVGIHRTILDGDILESEIARSIFSDGLKNFGDLSYGVVDYEPDVSKTVSFPGNILNMLILLKSSYKGSTGSFLLYFPRDVISKDGEILENKLHHVYNYINNVPHIKPEYILGYVNIENDIMEYLSKEEFFQKQKSTTNSK